MEFIKTERVKDLKASETRKRIITAADDLFYQQGYEHTSFSDIAEVVKISRGNFYHHFKTKDEILDAVIELRIANTKAMLDCWEKEGDEPTVRIRSFIHILIENQTKIMKFGCPVGTLCAELGKLNHASRDEAARLFELFRDWLARQFAMILPEDDVEALAMHLLARSQGIASLASTFHDKKFIHEEVRQLEGWLGQIAKTGTPETG